jgi:hypothetical protein
LGTFISTRQQDHHYRSVRAEINSVSGPDVDAKLAHSLADWLAITEAPKLNPAQPLADARLGCGVTKPPKPLGVRFQAVFALVSDDLDHKSSVA